MIHRQVGTVINSNKEDLCILIFAVRILSVFIKRDEASYFSLSELFTPLRFLQSQEWFYFYTWIRATRMCRNPPPIMFAFLEHTRETKLRRKGGVQCRWQEKGGRRDLQRGCVYVAALRYVWRHIIVARLRRRHFLLKRRIWITANIESHNN